MASAMVHSHCTRIIPIAWWTTDEYRRGSMGSTAAGPYCRPGNLHSVTRTDLSQIDKSRCPIGQPPPRLPRIRVDRHHPRRLQHACAVGPKSGPPAMATDGTRLLTLPIEPFLFIPVSWRRGGYDEKADYTALRAVASMRHITGVRRS